MDDTYLSFLQQLDDSQLIDHIKSLSQEAPLQAKPGSRVGSRSASFIYTSTPSKGNATIVKSFETDPFDDDLDSELLKIAVREPSTVSLESIPCNQLAMVRHADTSTDEEPEVPDIERRGLDDLLLHSPVIPDGNPEVHLDTEASDEPKLDEYDPNSDDVNIKYGEVGQPHKFGEYGVYFHNKHLKQQAADKAYVEWDRKRRKALGEVLEPSKIFEGCSIYVNGNTVPTLAVIHKLVILHGGKFLSYLHNKGAATHIVCDRLTPRKRIEFRNYKVVKAQWVKDCVDKDVLLDWKEYRLISEVEYDQQRLGFERIILDKNLNGSDTGEQNLHDDRKDIDDQDHLDELENDIENNPENNLENIFDDADAIENGLDDDIDTDVAFEDDLEQGLENGQVNCLLKEFSDIRDSSCNDTDGKLGHDKPELDDLDGALGHDLPNHQNMNQCEDPIILQLKASRNTSYHGAVNATHPDFLKHFFSNSRLHHLSMWKAALRSKFLRLIATKSLPNKDRIITDDERIILHIDFDCFFATASTLSHPELDIHKDPIAVSHGGNASDVASCNYVARKKGISNGMWLGKARKMCPELKIIDYEFNTYERCSTAFYNYLVSKNIFDSIFPVLIDEVLVDATTFCRQDLNSHKAVYDLCKQVRKDIFELTQCSVSVGASTNVLLAKLAIKKAKPDGFYYLHENIESFLDGIKIRDIPGIGRSLEYRLAEELNISSVFVRDVKQMTLTKLSTIFGEKTGLKLFQSCRGIDHTGIALDLSTSETLLGRKSVSVDVNFGIRFDTHAQAEVFLMNLAKELHTRLIDLGVCGSGLTLKLARRAPDAPVNPPKFMGMGRCDFFSKSTRLGVPTNDWGIIGSEMKSIFRILNIPAKELRGIAVSMTKLEDINAVKKNGQQTLRFDKKAVKKPVKLNSQVPYAERVTNSDSIDWDVFNLLPEEIRRELRQELRRRGIPVSGKERSPGTSPFKDSGRRVYIQQLFPTQVNGPFKHTRVVESPRKKRKVQVSPVKSVLPVKREPSPTPFNDTVSYDEEVLNELPSSIRNEFFHDLEWQKKNKRLVFIPMKEKIRKIEQDRQVILDSEITTEWIAQQPKLSNIPLFAGLSNYDEILEQLQQWVRLSVDDQGPHPDDVGLFLKYIEDVTRMRKISWIIGLIKVIRDEIQCQKTIALLSHVSKSKMLGVNDWKLQYEKMKDKVESICKDFKVTVEFV